VSTVWDIFGGEDGVLNMQTYIRQDVLSTANAEKRTTVLHDLEETDQLHAVSTSGDTEFFLSDKPDTDISEKDQGKTEG
jgi:hypothetical protein